jgi:chromosome segregation ATPase
MADDTLRHADPDLDGAIERFERAETELEEHEERRRRLAEEANRAASELEATLEHGIRNAIEQRDRLEEELAAVLDHLARLEAIRARSGGRRDAVEPARTVDLEAAPSEPAVSEAAASESPATEAEATEAYEDKWYELMKSRDDSAFTA